MSQPLTQQDFASLLSCLQNALNQNPEVQKQAEAYIQSLDSRAGFSSALAEIVGNREADHSARYLASVHLKNSIHRNWKKRVGASTGIGPEEKAHLRSRLSSLIPQEDNQIAVQVALVYAKVARFDYPAEWPGLFSDLLANVNGGSALTVRRVYLILHHVLKELSSKRLVADQAHFAQVTELLFGHVWGQWCADTQQLLAGLPAGLEAPPAGGSTSASQALLQSCERWMLLLKILRRLILHGFPSDAKTLAPVPAVHSCCPHMVSALQGLLGVRPRGKPLPRSHLQAMLDRAILKLLKTLCQVLEVHPWSFHGAGVLLPSMEVCASQLVEAAAPEQHPHPHPHQQQQQQQAGGAAMTAAASAAAAASTERRLTACCGLLIGVMGSKSYRGQAGGSLEPGSGQPRDTTRYKAMAAEVRAALEAFWAAPPANAAAAAAAVAAAAAGGAAAGGPAAAVAAAAGGGANSRLIALAGALVSRHMVLSRADLEQWREEPEEFAHSHGSGAWADSLALAAEQLYLVLLQAYREVLGPAVASLLPAVAAAAPPGVPADSLPGERVAGVPLALLYKDAVYAALAAGAYELHDYLDYGAWLTGSLLTELSDTCAANKPLRRRIGLVVAANVDRVREDDPIRPALYGAMLQLLSEPDPALCLSGLGALTALLGDFNFLEEPFAPLLPTCLQLLLHVMGGSSELDTQKQAFGLLNMVIERCGEALRPHVGALAGALPALWEAAAGQSLLRIQILEAVQRLLNLSGPASPQLLPGLVLPLLSYSLDLRQPETSEGLLEDGLALWLVALRNAPTCCEQDTAAAAAAAAAAGQGADGGGNGGIAPLAGQPPPLVLRLLPGPGPAQVLEALLSPFPALTAIAESSTEQLPAVMSILTSAALLAGPALWAAAGGHVVSVFMAVVGNVSERGMLLVFPALEQMLQAAPQAAAAGLQPVLLRLLGLLFGGKESGLVVTNALPVLGRLLLAAPQQLVALCGAAAADPAVAAALAAKGREGVPAELAPAEVVLWRLLELWAEAFDGLGQAGARRLCGLALCRALALPSRGLLGLLDVLLPPITAVWFETEGGGGDEDGGGCCWRGEGMPPSYDYFSAGMRGGGDEGLDEVVGPALDSEEAEGETARRAMLREADPAGAVTLGSGLRSGLCAAAALHGEAALNAALNALDPTLAAAVHKATAAAAAAGAAGGAGGAGGQASM
ncbi:hypothetical protein HYH02_008395 [Chlamydomonas schloesseri]|uniref:Importin N-terminal domain-containing protein n=1 Tax=Chlamydomonas schloesseri TaxID=2026947 RepID=A0A835WH05_9CHLO|nr:hypothetical protein HYH02_008395 [Chlamydomonas schloesseri]|eukprot:KAG2446835.1 hypothetical protein HYH02_008395 [Chlamydomonas schloesseri]